MKFYTLIIFLALLAYSCRSDSAMDSERITSNTYHIQGNTVTYNTEPIHLVGANALHTFAVGSADMPLWNFNIVREFVGNVNENPIAGPPIQDSNGKYLHALQDIVNDNRAHNLVTILCPFGWDGTPENLFTGKFPTQTIYWESFNQKLQLWAEHFKNQSDVWIQVWNEPYRFDRADGYTDAVWETTMNTLYSTIRTTGNTNIILIPCAEQGQDESVLINKGSLFLEAKTNVLFDIHAYEKWLLVPNENVIERIAVLQNLQLPLIFGEVAPVNAGVLMNPTFFLSHIYSKNIAFTAWLWKYDETDQNALLTTNGQPNDTNNNNWGSFYNNLALQPR